MKTLARLSLFAALALGCGREEPPARLPSSATAEPAEARNAAAAENAGVREVPARPARPAAPADIPAPPDVAAPPADAERTESGLASKVLEAGTGDRHPGPRDGVTVHYSGWRAENGELFDSSVRRGRPASFTLDRVIPGWTEGLQLMVEGEKRRLWIPAALAYEGRPGPQGMLVFDVELLSVNAAPETPDNVSAPPRNAERTASGLASIVLEEGEGDRHPAATDTVRVHYSGWRAEDGELFDSSRSRGEPASFRLDRVIAGWTEGVQLMVVGEKRRFWIPAALAYEGRPRGPQGMLVFDIELLGIGDVQ
ncbi:MAG: FKBP-type peptidyl-prolyl cis-trans isomerase [Myxococcota bacterium]|nr:FKBP-type peptidyl-prolyl cis-trans isomerase [Myxococcota bacterium]